MSDISIDELNFDLLEDDMSDKPFESKNIDNWRTSLEESVRRLRISENKIADLKKENERLKDLIKTIHKNPRSKESTEIYLTSLDDLLNKA